MYVVTKNSFSTSTGERLVFGGLLLQWSVVRLSCSHLIFGPMRAIKGKKHSDVKTFRIHFYAKHVVAYITNPRY